MALLPLRSTHELSTWPRRLACPLWIYVTATLALAVLPAESCAVTVRVLLPLCSRIVALQFAVPEAVPVRLVAALRQDTWTMLPPAAPVITMLAVVVVLPAAGLAM